MVELFKGVSLREAQKNEGWRRIRVGLAGLAVIVTILAISSGVLNRVGDQANSTAAKSSVASDNAIAPSEPMAGLGVAPGAATEPKKP
ncbi:MAG: hypothetical protein RIS52_289 [Pseudomonadota bacterium]|jgi:hypothetical protein